MGWGGSLFFALILLAAPASAAPLDLTAGVEVQIGRYLHSLAEPGAPLSPQEALAAFEGGAVQPLQTRGSWLWNPGGRALARGGGA